MKVGKEQYGQNPVQQMGLYGHILDKYKQSRGRLGTSNCVKSPIILDEFIDETLFDDMI